MQDVYLCWVMTDLCDPLVQDTETNITSVLFVLERAIVATGCQYLLEGRIDVRHGPQSEKVILSSLVSAPSP